MTEIPEIKGGDAGIIAAIAQARFKHIREHTFDVSGHTAYWCAACDNWADRPEDIVHDDDCAAMEAKAQAETIRELRSIIDGLECSRPVKRDIFFERDGREYFRVENVSCGKCPVCRAKLAAQSVDKDNS